MKRLFISQSNYIPWKGYFNSIAMCDTYVIYDDMQYTRRDWRNRNYIKTKNGLQWLTIPVEVKGRYQQKINETLISDKNWNKNHWEQIRHCYLKAPFFNVIMPWVEELYLTANFSTLTEVNIHFLSGICSFLNIKTEFIDSRAFQIYGDKNERLVNIATELGATDYYTGPSSKNYLDENLFEKENIKVHYFNFNNFNEYMQPYPPFQHSVSILDLLFNTGDKSKLYLKDKI